MSTGTDESITFDPETETYRLRPDRRREESATAAVTRGVAVVTNTPPTELTPLFETIDPDALDRLYDSTDGTAGATESSISFRYNDCAVTVYATGTVEITPDEDPDPMTARVPRAIRDR